MDVAFITTDLGVKGAARRIVELSNGLIGRGHRVTVYSKNAEPCQWLPLKARVAQWDGMGRHDAVICCGGSRTGHRLLLEADTAVKVMYVLGIGNNEDSNRATVTRALKKNTTSFTRVINSSVGVIANCTPIAEYFQSQGYDCGIVLGGVNSGTFYPKARKDPQRVLWVGTRRIKTGTADCLAAMNIIRETAPNLYRQSYAYRNFSQDELAKVYSGATYFLDAHYSGGWNNPVAEAMACGTAVVCTDIDGTEDFAFHEETALLVEPRDVEAMARSVLRLFSDPRLRGRLRQNALDYISEFTWERATTQLEGWLEEQL